MADSHNDATTPADDTRFEELLYRYLENQLAPGEQEELDRLLLADASRVRELYRGQLLARTLSEYQRAWNKSQLHSRQQSAPSPPPVYRPLTLGYWRARPARFAALALSLTLVFWAGIYSFVFLKNGVDHNIATTGVATVTNMRGVHWAVGTTEYQRQDALEAGDTLHLTAGFVEVTFEHGAVVLLEAPIEFTVETRGAGRLEQGRLFARIEKQAESSQVVPFSISTPLAEIIDRGTQFGVAVGADGTTNISVFEGRVEATPRSAPDARKSRLNLTRGQAGCLQPGQIRFDLLEDSQQYVQEIPEAIPQQDAQDDIAWVPPGLNSGDTYQLVFVTSNRTNAQSNEIASYNAFVDQAMGTLDDVSPHGDISWRAIASTASVAARDNALISAPVYNLAGYLVAENANDFWDGAHRGPINITQHYKTYQGSVLTGTNVDGTSGNLSLGTGTEATLGNADSEGPDWIHSDSAANIHTQLPCYALSEVLTVP